MKNELLGVLRSCSNPKICILGIGAEFKADDAAGVFIAQQLQAKCEDKKCSFTSSVLCIDGSTAPENFTGDIKKFGPTHLLIIDAAEMGEKPGTIRLIPSDKVGGVSFSTHVLPIAVMINYLKQSISFESVIIGIEPKDLEFGKEMTNDVKESVDKLTNIIFDTIGTCLNK
jgi:hydrogenase 3 maturation protease